MLSVSVFLAAQQMETGYGQDAGTTVNSFAGMIRLFLHQSHRQVNKHLYLVVVQFGKSVAVVISVEPYDVKDRLISRKIKAQMLKHDRSSPDSASGKR